MVNISIEQSFQVKKFSLEIEKMSEEKIKKMLINYFEQMILLDNYYKQAISEKWGISDGDMSNV